MLKSKLCYVIAEKNTSDVFLNQNGEISKSGDVQSFSTIADAIIAMQTYNMQELEILPVQYTKELYRIFVAGAFEFSDVQKFGAVECRNYKWESNKIGVESCVFFTNYRDAFAFLTEVKQQEVEIVRYGNGVYLVEDKIDLFVYDPLFTKN